MKPPGNMELLAGDGLWRSLGKPVSREGWRVEVPGCDWLRYECRLCAAAWRFARPLSTAAECRLLEHEATCRGA